MDHSTRYNSQAHTSYAPHNLIGKYSRYPSYGGFPDTYALRTFGKWWKSSECTYQSNYMPNDQDPLGAEDYFTVLFNQAVLPKRVYIYETHCPGSIVRIWGRRKTDNWTLLWEEAPKVCRKESRKFDPPLRKINKFINELRIELNCSLLVHHAAFDAVLLSGYPAPESEFQIKCLGTFNLKEIDDSFKENNSDEICTDNKDLIDVLPYEVIIHIFQHLDLKSLSRCARVNKRWNQITLDPILYQNISLKKYWHVVNLETLRYFSKRCKNLKKLDLSWCEANSDTFNDYLIEILKNCSKTLTHISLCNSKFANDSIVATLGNLKELNEIRLKNCLAANFQPLSFLNKLVVLDLYSTDIINNQLIPILKNNPNLKHINLDFCEHLENLDEIVKTVTINNKNLVGWSSWKVRTLSAEGVGYFGTCKYLEDLDLGWNLFLSPGNSLEKIAVGCKNLKRIILSGWRAIVDPIIIPLIDNCKKLQQIDLLSVTAISEELIQRAINNLPDLQLLELSFCSSISQEQVDQWRIRYPYLTIQNYSDNDEYLIVARDARWY